MIYDEAIDVHELSRPLIQRGSHVEPIDDGRWIIIVKLLSDASSLPAVAFTAALSAVATAHRLAAAFPWSAKRIRAAGCLGALDRGLRTSAIECEC